MVLQRQIPKVPMVGVYPCLGFRGILVFRLVSILRTMCGLRTGGWSLPYVMSD
jgi:hypothetical protein